jgi:SET domain-containing protein
VLSADDDRFTNHSGTPNTKYCGEYSIAVRDILPDEEITANYGEYGECFKEDGETE